MFRGMSIGQLRGIAGAVVMLCGAFLAGRHFAPSRATGPGVVELHGPVEHHAPGQLVPQPVVIVPAAAAPPPAKPTAPAAAVAPTPPVVLESLPGMLPGGRVDLNAATAEVLEMLPGIGPSKAQAIIEERERRGGRFAAVEELDDVPGFGEKTVERLRPHLAIEGAPGDTSPAPRPAAAQAPVAINRATAEELQSLKGIGPALAQEIMAHRRRVGRLRGPKDLLAVKGIGPKIMENNAGRIVYD